MIQPSLDTNLSVETSRQKLASGAESYQSRLQGSYLGAGLLKGGPLAGFVREAAHGKVGVVGGGVRREHEGALFDHNAVHDLRVLHAGPRAAARHHLPQQHAKRIHIRRLHPNHRYPQRHCTTKSPVHAPVLCG